MMKDGYFDVMMKLKLMCTENDDMMFQKRSYGFPALT